MRFQLRDYQLDAVEKARAAIRAGKKRPLIVAPTGSGKTVIACEIVEQAVSKGTCTLFIAHRIELIEQTSAKLDEIGVDHGIIKAGHRRTKTNLPVQVASVQTLFRRLGKINAGATAHKLIIVDEAHHCTAESYKRILQSYEDAVVLGLTATPYRADGAPLGSIFNELVQVTTLGDLIEAGHLVEPRVFGRKPPDLTKVKTVGNDYNLGQLAKVMDQVDLVENIVSTWKERASGRTTVVFAVSIEHSKHIAQTFNDAGVPAGHLDGEMPEQERAAVLRELAEGRLQVVSNCAILTEGWDLPQCSCVVLARPTKSRSLWKQMCGRALRPAPGKTDCFVLDHAGCWKRHGFLTDADDASLSAKEREKGEAPDFQCPYCAASFLGWPKYCPECDEELPRRIMESTDAGVAGELTEISQLAEQILFYEELARTARTRGYKPTWVAIKFRDRFNMYPAAKHMGQNRWLKTKVVELDGKFTRAWVLTDDLESRESRESTTW